MEEKLGIGANVFMELRDANGNLKDTREIHNTVTTGGKNGIADQILASPSLTKVGWMEVGTGSGGTTALNAAIAASRTAMASPKTRSGAEVTMVTTFGAGVGTGNITEAGTFDANSAGNMWMYATFATITKAAGDTLTITWKLTVS